MGRKNYNYNILIISNLILHYSQNYKLKVQKIVVFEFEHLSKKFKERGNWSIDYFGIKVSTLGLSNTNPINGILISGIKTLKKLPDRTKENLIEIPIDEIDRIEFALENIANVISLVESSKRTILSTIPSIFLIPENENDKIYLDNSTGFKFNSKKRTNSNYRTQFDMEFCLQNLADRLDGIAIISEANATGHLAGKFHEYFRFFERAFKRSNKGLLKPLSEFLSKNDMMGYSETEIENWIDIRHRSVHANNKKGFVVERDLRSYVPRLEQAVYEVLFNKASWHNKSTLRRSLLDFPVGTVNSSNEKYFKHGTAFKMDIQPLDETSSYPISFKEVFGELPDNAWAPITKEIKFAGDSLSVIPDKE